MNPPINNVDHEARFNDWEVNDTCGISVGGFGLGFIAGALIGASIALLCAPQPGEEVRQEIADTGASLKNRVSDVYGAATTATSEVVTSAMERVETVVDSSKQAVQETKGRLDVAVVAGKQAYREKKVELDAQLDAVLEH